MVLVLGGRGSINSCIIRSMNVLQVTDLSKEFEGKDVISDLNFSVTPGSITGFLGPNGAGKSTTMNIIMGFIKASKGTVRIFDELVTINSPKTRSQVGYLSNSSKLDRTLSAKQEIEYFGRLGGTYDREYVDTLVRRLKLDVNQKIGGLSTGNYQKVALIIALMHRPRLLILDEPTNGLDPLIQAEFNKIITELRDTGSTIFISSHILSDVQQLCDEFIFIKNGAIVAQLTKDDLLASTSKVVTIRTNDKNHDEVVALLNERGVEHEVSMGSLDDVFMRYYGERNE